MKRGIYGLMDGLIMGGLVPKKDAGQRISFAEWYMSFLDVEIKNIKEHEEGTY